MGLPPRPKDVESMKCYVITCNDSVEFAIISTLAEAEDKKDVLSYKHFESNRAHYDAEHKRMTFGMKDPDLIPQWLANPYAYYLNRHHWAARRTLFSIAIKP